MSGTASRLYDRPLASHGLVSYRYRGDFGFVMIGAKNHFDALNQARRSISRRPDPRLLEVWDGEKYVPVESEQ